MSIVGWFHQKVYPRLLPIGTVVWTIAAILICAFDGKSWGVGTIIFINNLHLGLSSTYKNHDTHIKVVNHIISMYCGAIILLLIISLRFGVSVFELCKYQLLAFIINFTFYLIYWIIANINNSIIEGNKPNDK